jgi:glutamine cyclotransferase
MKKSLQRMCVCLGLIVITAGCKENPATPEDFTPPATIIDYSFLVLNTYPHDRSAFTEGFVYRGGFIYEGTGLYGQSVLRKVSLETGDVLQQVDLNPGYFGEGIAIFDEKIYQLTWLSKKGFIYQVSNFDSVGQFTYQHEGWGMTSNDSCLIMSNGSATLHFLDPLTLEQTHMIEVRNGNNPVYNLNELEYIEGKIFANVWLTDWIMIIDPLNGQISGRINLSGLLDPVDHLPGTDVLNGIAYDPDQKRLFVTGKRWPKVFEIILIPMN